MKLLHKGTVKDHKLIFDNPEAFTVAKTLLEGKRFELTLDKEKVTRTSASNRYLWGVVYAVISEATGYDPEQVHDAMKEKFASTRLENGLMITERTSKMDTIRFTKYVDDIKRFAAEFFQVYIPDADEFKEEL